MSCYRVFVHAFSDTDTQRGKIMQNQIMATWIIAAFLFSVMAIFSVIPSYSGNGEHMNSFSSTSLTISSTDMSANLLADYASNTVSN